MLICKECYETFSNDTYRRKCNCGGDLVSAGKCKICGEWYDLDEMNDEVCDSCLEENMTLKNAIESGKEQTAQEKILVSGFLAKVFTDEEIETILESALKEKCSSSDSNLKEVTQKAIEWLSEDKYWFADWLIEKGRVSL